MFDKEELNELKKCINEMIAARQTYMTTVEGIEHEMIHTKAKLEVDYRLLDKVLGLLESD